MLETILRHSTTPHSLIVQVIDTGRDATSLALIWGGFTTVLGVLISIRTNAAYQRFWEGARLVYLVRGEWFNCVSSLLAFCSDDPAMRTDVELFQNVLVRLASLLHGMALQHVCEVAEDSLEVLDTDGLNEESLIYLETVHDRCEVLVQWLQRLIVTARRSKLIDVADPILTRSLQEMSRGVVNLNNVRRIKDIPFPYPYHQVILILLMLHWLATPILASLYIHSAVLSTVFVFIGQAGFWSLIYTASQLDQPFGEDANDLPMAGLQQDFNRSLLSLLHPLSKQVPSFTQGAIGPRSASKRKTLKMDVLSVNIKGVQVEEPQESGEPEEAERKGEEAEIVVAEAERKGDEADNGDGLQPEEDLEVGDPNHNTEDNTEDRGIEQQEETVLQVQFISGGSQTIERGSFRDMPPTFPSEASLVEIPRTRRPSAPFSPKGSPKPADRLSAANPSSQSDASVDIIDLPPPSGIGGMERGSSAQSAQSVQSVQSVVSSNHSGLSVSLAANPLRHKARNLRQTSSGGDSMNGTALRHTTLAPKTRELKSSMKEAADYIHARRLSQRSATGHAA